jgi:microcystin-dependent protein
LEISMAEPFLGQITVFPYNFPPRGWADCAGQLLPISQNTALFSLLGTAYGGNGTSNFALPDLQGRVPIAQGSAPGLSPYVMGETGGQETVSLQGGGSASHAHVFNATTAHGTSNTPEGAILATPQSGGLQGGNKGDIYNTATPDTSLAAASVSSVGGSQPHNNLQPSLVLRYCIALQGIFPSRS